MGLRFRKHVRSLPGNPDIVFVGPRVVVFCDGDFWHGRNWPELSVKLSHGTNGAYWLAKIQTNMDRDVRNTALLREAGWLVVRLWEGDIKKDVRAAAEYVGEIVKQRRSPVPDK
jgi:DNA mismatch endonuclease, patch repair protein